MGQEELILLNHEAKTHHSVCVCDVPDVEHSDVLDAGQQGELRTAGESYVYSKAVSIRHSVSKINQLQLFK